MTPPTPIGALGVATAEPGEMDAAWAEAEAALPVGWFVGGLHLLRLPTHRRPIWQAVSVQPMTTGSGQASGEGDTPAAALRALAARFREAR